MGESKGIVKRGPKQVFDKTMWEKRTYRMSPNTLDKLDKLVEFHRKQTKRKLAVEDLINQIVSTHVEEGFQE